MSTKSRPSLGTGWLSSCWAPLLVSQQSCATGLMFFSSNGGEPLPFSGQNRLWWHISQDFVVKLWKNEPCDECCMNEIPVCKYSVCRCCTLVYKLSYTTIPTSRCAGKQQDQGHSLLLVCKPCPFQRVFAASLVLPGATHSRFPWISGEELGSWQDLAHTTWRNVSASVALGLAGFWLPSRAEADSSHLWLDQPQSD